MDKNIKKHKYHVSRMHCASCELIIEKKLLELDSVKSVKSSTSKEEVSIEYEGAEIDTQKLNTLFKKEGYVFSDSSPNSNLSTQKQPHILKPKESFIILAIGLLIILGFLGLNSTGLSGLINVSAKSSLPTFFIFGLIAGISSCAALVGGIILSMSQQWNQLHSTTDSTWGKIQPHLIFNIGRLIAYGFFGALLGALGSQLDFSLKLGPIFVIAVSILMIFLALQMLGIKAFKKFQVTLPKFITQYIADESNFKGYHMPFLMGALTFFLPCGFTITAQGLALISGSALQGGLIMFIFALGTLPMLLGIGISSIKFCQKSHLSERFLKVAGILVLFFALFNINSQLNVLGFASLSNLGSEKNRPISVSTPTPSPSTSENNSTQIKPMAINENLAPIVNGKQVIKMEASSSGYSPNKFKVRADVPVRWEITDTGTSGCTNAIIAKSLFEGEISLTPGKTSIQEFTPKKAGKYKFSCWMGMVTGTIEVIN
ncbi:MAG: urease accessory protein UreH domain-containing protein [Candidatus Moraniibacteriota bacterium]